MNVAPKVVPKTVRTNADIRDAVQLWCADVPNAVRKYGTIADWDTSACTDFGKACVPKKSLRSEIADPSCSCSVMAPEIMFIALL